MSRPRVFPPLIMIAIAAVMWWLDRYIPMMDLMKIEWQRLGYVLFAAAIVIDLWALGMFRRSDTSVHPLRLERNRALVTHGIYRFTRNPMYLGLLVLLTGFAFRLGSLTPFLMLPLFIWIIQRGQIVHEERFLAARYGSAYQDYRAKVRRWL